MAIADNVLVGIRSEADLQELDILPGENELRLLYNTGAEKKVILRKYSKAGDVTDELMPKSAFLNTQERPNKCWLPLRAFSSWHTARSG